jgi:hypothetical protein
MSIASSTWTRYILVSRFIFYELSVVNSMSSVQFVFIDISFGSLVSGSVFISEDSYGFGGTFATASGALLDRGFSLRFEEPFTFLHSVLINVHGGNYRS